MPTTEEEEWTVDDHREAGNEDTIALFDKLRALIDSFGPGSISVSKTTVTFKGTRRGFAGARPTKRAVIGYLDLMRQLPPDHRIGSIAPYGRNLYTHHYTLHDTTELDNEFVSWLQDAYAVGCGAHLRPPATN